MKRKPIINDYKNIREYKNKSIENKEKKNDEKMKRKRIITEKKVRHGRRNNQWIQKHILVEKQIKW